MNTAKQAAISTLILREFAANGGDIKAAFDKVFGKGAYSKLAGDVYRQLRGE